MIKIDVDLKDSKHILVEHNIECDEQFAYELAIAIDLIISEKIGDDNLSVMENVANAVSYRNHILKLIKATVFCCPECYEHNE